jgi:hypothetical protein
MSAEAIFLAPEGVVPALAARPSTDGSGGEHDEDTEQCDADNRASLIEAQKLEASADEDEHEAGDPQVVHRQQNRMMLP